MRNWPSARDVDPAQVAVLEIPKGLSGQPPPAARRFQDEALHRALYPDLRRPGAEQLADVEVRVVPLGNEGADLYAQTIIPLQAWRNPAGAGDLPAGAGKGLAGRPRTGPRADRHCCPLRRGGWAMTGLPGVPMVSVWERQR